MVTRERSAYFFPHALTPGGGPPNPPGRVPFDVEAQVSDGDTSWTEQVTIFGDGYARNTIGPNQDPCVVAAPKPFHSFCRIDGTDSDDRVRGTALSLSAAVQPNDLIIYGKFEPRGLGPTERIWVDAVLVVDRTVRWSTATRRPGDRCPNARCEARRRARPYVLRQPAAFASLLTGLRDGAATDAYVYNLRDAESAGYHCCTTRSDYQVIVGLADPDASALRSLQSSFAPLACFDAEMQVIGPTSVAQEDFADGEWDRVTTFIDTVVRTGSVGPRGSWIAQFDDLGVAEALCRAVIAASRFGDRSGVVATLPVRLLAPAARLL